MAEHHSFTPAFRSWKSLSGQELHQRLASLGLVLDTEEKVIICTKCQYALKPSDAVSKHLGDRHEISAKARRGLNAFVKQLQLPDPSRLEPRPDGCAPHSNLATKSGVACGQCNYRSTSLDLAQRHFARTHGEKSGRKTWLRDHLRKDLFLQSWTQNGSAYWIVALNEANNSGAHLDTLQASPQRRQKLTTLHERELQRARNQETRLPGEDSSASDLALKSNWIRRTGWLETFAGVDRQLLSRLGSAPAREGFPLLLADDVGGPTQSSIEDESKLSNLGKAADHFFDRCEDTARNTDHSIRCWLRSHVQGRPYKAAFQLPGRCTTRKRYRWLWKSMIYFVLRLWRLDDDVRERMLELRLCTLSTRMNRLCLFASPNATGSRGSGRLIGLLAYERGGQSRVLERVYALLSVDFVPILSTNRRIVAHGTWTSLNTSPNTRSFFPSYVKPPFTLLRCPKGTCPPSAPTLRSYASLECVAFPRITHNKA